MLKQKVIVLFLLTFFTNFIDGYNILVIFGHPGKSHYDVFSGLFEELAARGHNLTILSHVRGKNSLNTRVSLQMLCVFILLTGCFLLKQVY